MAVTQEIKLMFFTFYKLSYEYSTAVHWFNNHSHRQM